ncbi:MAG: zinc-binding dehydrogenase [Fulvivirga sp.]|uniref:zinc-binding dehydrogenase n=1 Tax=Fulvivirga sp. TaxID=1931237 RepID=UPI0032EDB50C
MKALAIVSAGKIKIINKDRPKPEPNQAIIKVSAAALNKRDQFIREGKYPNIQFGSTLGSDAVGEVVEVGESVSKKLIGRRVIINPNIGWGNNEQVQSRVYSILGMPSDGTFAEFVAVEEGRLHPVPGHLSDEEAASIPLAGLTAYRALFRHGEIKKNENILISGFGGGVAQFAFQYAMAFGANVFVTSGSNEKIEKAISLGAQAGYNYTNPDWHKNLWQTKGGFDVVIDSAGGDQVNTFVKLMRPGGRIVFYGATNGLPSSLDLYRMFWNQIKLQGSTMGNDKEFVKMLDFITEHKIKPLIDSVRPFDEIESAFDEIATSSKLGKLVVKL